MSVNKLMFLDKKLLRKTARRERKKIPTYARILAERKLFQKIIKQPSFIKAKNIALYLANDGEMSVQLLLASALNRGKRIYLPQVQDRDMVFRRYTIRDRLHKNTYGIAEPHVSKKRIRCHRLDLVLVPLVAFDAGKNRLGMGGGFYDKAFSFRAKPWRRTPFLLGVAHQCQFMERIPKEPLDISLDAVVSDVKVIT